MIERTKIVEMYRDIRADYAYDPDIMSEQDDRARRVFFIVWERLSVVERTVLLLYAETQSYRKLGALMGLSYVSVREQILKIRKKIAEELQKPENNV